MKSSRPQVRRAGKVSARRSPANSTPSGVPARGAARLADVLGRSGAASISTSRVPSKWRWHFRVLIALRNRLLHEHQELLTAASEPLEPHSLSEADSATDEFDHDFALGQLSAEQDSFYEVSEALGRILDGSYGVCEETGRTIPAARLRAVPWTRFTREVEARLETSGHSPGARLNRARTVRSKGLEWLPADGATDENNDSPLSPAKDEMVSQIQLPLQPGLQAKPDAVRTRPQLARKRKGKGE